MKTHKRANINSQTMKPTNKIDTHTADRPNETERQTYKQTDKLCIHCMYKQCYIMAMNYWHDNNLPR